MKMPKKSLRKRSKKDLKNMHSRVSMGLGQAGVNCQCHTLNVQVPPKFKHIMPNPRIVLILWGNYYATNPAVGTSATQLITDLVTSRFMNGLAQYGVVRGAVKGQSIVINIPPPTPDPTNLTRDAISIQLSNWIQAGIVPAPAVNEVNLLYVILLPTGSTITDLGAFGYHLYNWFNNDPSTDDANLFWAVIVTNSAPQTPPANFVSSLAYIISHELCEAFTDRDDEGFETDDGCEIGDICENQQDPNCASGAKPVRYQGPSGTIWQVEKYWSNWDNKCINGDQPVSVKRFLQAIGIDGSRGLRQLGSSVVNVNFVAFRMLDKLDT
jgi:hypothetical protein